MNVSQDPIAFDVLEAVPRVPSAELVLLSELDEDALRSKWCGRHVRVVGVVMQLDMEKNWIELGEHGSVTRVPCVLLEHASLEAQLEERVEVLGEVASIPAQGTQVWGVRVRLVRPMRGLDMQLHVRSVYMLRDFLARQEGGASNVKKQV